MEQVAYKVLHTIFMGIQITANMEKCSRRLGSSATAR